MAKRKIKRTIRNIIIIFMVLCGLIIADSRLRLVVTEYEVGSERLPEEFDGFRIVQLSDIHGRVFGRDSSYLLGRVAEAEPDIIALTGDLVDRYTDLEDMEILLSGLAEIAPVYYVSGNHEWAETDMDVLSGILAEHGVNYLCNQYVTLERGGSRIVLAGAEDPNGWRNWVTPEEMVDIMRGSFPDEYTVLLGHRNYWVEKYPFLDVDLILCGHAHGGIIRLPFAGGLVGTGFELFPGYVDGVFSSGSYEMVVSRGLGGTVPVPRFLNNPEIVLVSLSSEKG